MKTFTATTDPKTARIHASWFQPSHRNARWLASIADEIVHDGTAPVSSDEFIYVSLHESDCNGAASVLAIPATHVELAARRIPALLTIGYERVALAA